ncbi:hypothetical protein [Natrarchaeobius oligotrophus]|uniref:Uncharacterized protein n=1 Tax=Natrarchaeobius chitinivorans TaxID=1679083 RepID=A0A3N6M8V0_NATCH|nr:hypothetical protein [Natrarchaeobius chitinivorans]RQH00099.1 hypothetical protein EA472_12895 [Natrarchaeobius chitinivorans]
MSNFKTRRRLLQLTGTGITASVAGCSDLSVTDSGNGDGSDGQQELTAIAEPQASEIQDLQEQVFEGELSEEEAIQRQQELHQEAIDNFEDRVDSESDADLSIEEGEEGSGLYLVDGSADVLVDALRTGDIAVLGSSDLYDQIQQQQQQQQQPDGDEIDEEDLEEIQDELEGDADDAESEDEGDATDESDADDADAESEDD